MTKPHNSYLCSPHCCDTLEPECEDKEHTWCNPYFVAGYCPTDGEGDQCQANRDDLVHVTVEGGGGFFWAMRQDFDG